VMLLRHMHGWALAVYRVVKFLGAPFYMLHNTFASGVSTWSRHSEALYVLCQSRLSNRYMDAMHDDDALCAWALVSRGLVVSLCRSQCQWSGVRRVVAWLAWLLVARLTCCTVSHGCIQLLFELTPWISV